jgi:UDP-glucose 4-epimerase
MQPTHLPTHGWAKDCVEVEAYVRGLARRRPDLTVTTLRMANLLGPNANTPMAQYFSLPVVPTVLGYDARLQFLHETDALEVLRLATVQDHPGTFNVAGDGVLALSQAIRRAGRVAVPVWSPFVGVVGRWVRRGGFADFSPEQTRLLTHGRAVDCARLKEHFGFVPRYTTALAFEDFVDARRLNNVLSPELVAGAQDLAGRILTGGRHE